MRTFFKVAFCVVLGLSVLAVIGAVSAPEPGTVSSSRRDSNIREFDAQLAVWHGSQQRLTTGADLEDGVEKLVASGMAPDEAFRAILITVQNPALNPAMAYQIADLGRRIAAAKNGRLTR